MVLPTLSQIITVAKDEDKDREKVLIRVRPSEQQKCPRCWTYTRAEEDQLCKRCEKVVEIDHSH